MTQQAPSADPSVTAVDAVIQSPTDAPSELKTSEGNLPADVTRDRPVEIGGREGPEPTRFGDWELRGRCIDF